MSGRKPAKRSSNFYALPAEPSAYRAWDGAEAALIPLMEQGWAVLPAGRPSTGDILETLTALSESVGVERSSSSSSSNSADR